MGRVALVWCFLSLAAIAGGERILAVFTAPSVSHHVVYNRYLEELHRVGHDITVATPCPVDAGNRTNYRQIDFRHVYDYFKATFSGTMEVSSVVRILPEVLLLYFHRPMMTMCEMYLSHPEMKALLDGGEKFDLFIGEWGILACVFPYMKLAGNVSVGITSFAPGPWTHRMIGSTSNPAYVPEMGFPYSSRMTFLQRLRNAVMYSCVSLYMAISNRCMDEIARKHFGADTPSVNRFHNELSVLLANYHVSMNHPRPSVPVVVPIGGPPFHLIGKKPETLPKDLQQYLDNAKEGVVYFSLGSNVKSEAMPAEKREVFIRAFEQIKQKVLWKWEGDVLPGKPDNVRIGKWFPQTDILAHPNVKAFVTQGGLQSISEATYNTVPMVVIPFFADQDLNAKKLTSEGVAVRVDYETLSLESFASALKDVLDDRGYKERMVKYSALTQDQPQSPLDRAVWWTEYVIRHNGARHLRSAAVDMPWYQYLLLDVMAFLAAVTFLFFYVLYLILRFITRILFRRSKTKTD